MFNKRTIAFFLAICIMSLFFSCLPALSKQDINSLSDTALYTEMKDIDGIGPALASRIVVYRNANKPISINDLDNVPGIGEKKLNSIKRKFKE